MSDTKHTPTPAPWFLDGLHICAKDDGLVITLATVAQWQPKYHAERDANARLIIQSRNAFEPMVEALRPVMAKANEVENGAMWREMAHHKSGKSQLGVYLTFAELSAIEAALKLAEETK